MSHSIVPAGKEQILDPGQVFKKYCSQVCRFSGCGISDTAVANILRAHGIDPALDRKRQSSWKDFLHTHWDVLASVDFTAIGVWTKKGLATYYVLFFMELAMRRVHFAGLSTNPDEGWMLQGMSPMPSKVFWMGSDTC
jgi:hypothetical protein